MLCKRMHDLRPLSHTNGAGVSVLLKDTLFYALYSQSEPTSDMSDSHYGHLEAPGATLNYVLY